MLDIKPKKTPSYYVSTSSVRFKIGDIVTENELIVPADRGPWNGLILHVEKDAWEFSTISSAEPQDRVIILWLDSALTEELPASVVLLVYRAEEG